MTVSKDRFEKLLRRVAKELDVPPGTIHRIEVRYVDGVAVGSDIDFSGHKGGLQEPAVGAPDVKPRRTPAPKPPKPVANPTAARKRSK